MRDTPIQPMEPNKGTTLRKAQPIPDAPAQPTAAAQASDSQDTQAIENPHVPTLEIPQASDLPELRLRAGQALRRFAPSVQRLVPAPLRNLAKRWTSHTNSSHLPSLHRSAAPSSAPRL